MSFLIDPPLLVCAGAAIERWSPNERASRVVSHAVLATFLVTSASLYVNAGWTRALWPAFGAASGRDWMLNSGVFSFPHEQPPPAAHLVAAGLFAAYPWFLGVGRRAARRGPQLAGDRV